MHTSVPRGWYTDTGRDPVPAPGRRPGYPAHQRSRARGGQAQPVRAEPQASREAVSLEGRGSAKLTGDVV